MEQVKGYSAVGYGINMNTGIFIKKNLYLIISISAQLFFFYIFPLFLISSMPIAMVILIILATFINSIFLGATSNSKLKFLYPLIVCAVFLPSVYIFYNSSALVHALWYTVISSVGLSIGSLIHFIIKKVADSL